MGKGPGAALAIMVVIGLIAFGMSMYVKGRNDAAVIAERGCLLDGSIKANGTEFRCERISAKD